MSFNPYQSPPTNFAPAKPGLRPGQTPGVWPWYVAYCVFMTLLYLFAMGIGIVFIVFPEKLAEPDENPISYTIMGVMFIAICIPFVLMYAAAPLLPKKRWAWIYGIVMIVIGLNGCPIFFSVPLLIFWLKAETKAYFGADRPT